MSGNLLFVRRMGERLPSSGTRYFSLFLRTFETVLEEKELVKVKLDAQAMANEPSLNTEHSWTIH